MTDAISRSAVLDFLTNNIIIHEDEIDLMEEVCHTIKVAPALDVAPVVHAKWGEAEVVGYDGIRVIYGFPCGRCGRHVRHIGCNWCPWCGAKMDATSNVPETNVGVFGGVINAVD